MIYFRNCLPLLQQEAHFCMASTMDEQRNELGDVAEDSNNNIPSENREQANEPSVENAASGQASPAVREIYKNSWLKKMPGPGDKHCGRFPKALKPTKYWVAFCVHDDKDPFLEFYENRRSAYSHMPMIEICLTDCLHISPTLVSHENDHEFVITMGNDALKLAASTNEQMLEWMDTLRNTLRELGVLEPKENIYSKEPITACSSRPLSISSASESLLSVRSQSSEDFSWISVRDPNSPLPPVPIPEVETTVTRESSTPNSAVIYLRNPPILRASRSPNSTTPISDNSETHSEVQPMAESITGNSGFAPNTEHHAQRILRSDSAVSNVGLTSPSEGTTLYEPLFLDQRVSGLNQPLQSISIRNPNYENPPTPRRHLIQSASPALPPRPPPDQRRMSSSVVGDVHLPSRTRGMSSSISTSEPSLNASPRHSGVNIVQSDVSNQHLVGRSPVHHEVGSSMDQIRQQPLEEGPPPYSAQQRDIQHNSASVNGIVHVNENGKPLSLREIQVHQLQAEILHKAGVRLTLRKKDCFNAIALVEYFGHVWIAGWKQKEHPLLHNTFHVGDHIISIGGHRIYNVQDAQKAIKNQPSIVEFVVRRMPYGKVLAIKRDYVGQDLGIVREGGTAEIKEVKECGLVFKYGLPLKASTLDGNSQCNWILTEINHRPLNLFYKDNEVRDRLNAVGLDISLLVQPSDLVKYLKKQLKTFRSYKDYIVQ